MFIYLLLALTQGVLHRTSESFNDIVKPTSHQSYVNDQIAIDFYWDFGEEDVTMMLVYDKVHFFGFGIGKDMINSDMWLFEIEEGVVKVTDAYSVAQHKPDRDIDVGGTEDIVVLGYEYDVNGKTSVKFRRALDTGDAKDTVLKQTGQLAVVWAYHKTKDVTSYHSGRGTYNVRFIQGYESDNNDIKKLPSHQKHQTSQITLQIYWDIQPEQVTFLIAYDKIHFFAFGLGSSMTNTDMWLFEYNDGILKATDAYSLKHEPPKSDVTLGGTNDIQILGYEYNNNGWNTIKFTRKLNTGDQYDTAMAESNALPVFWAYHETKDVLSYHTGHGEFDLHFVNGYDSDDSDLKKPTSHQSFVNDQIRIDFYWDFVGEEIIMMLQYSKVHFFGFGIGKDMTNSDIWLFEIVNGNIQVTDAFSEHQGKPKTDIELGGKNDLKVLGFEIDNEGKNTVKFSRKLQTGDKYDAELKQGKVDVIWAYSDQSDTTAYHQGKGTYQVNLVQGYDSDDITIWPSHSKYKAQDIVIDFYWDFSADNSTVTMMLVYNKNHFFGFGLGATMTDADMWLFEIKEEQLQLTDSYSSGQKKPDKDIDIGGHEDLQLLHYKIKEDKTYVQFRRKAKTADATQDRELVQTEALNVIYAYHDTSDTLTKHTGRGGFVVKFIQGYDSDAQSWSDWGWYDYHRFANMICWGFLVDIGIMVARYGKTYKYRAELHGFIMLIVCTVSLIYSWLMLYQHIHIFESEVFDASALKVKFHFILGLSIMILILAQVIGGIILRMQLLSKSVNEKISKKPQLHSIFGHAIYLIAKINIGIGIYIYPEDFYVNGLYIVYVIIFLWRIAFEILYELNYFIKIIVRPNSSNQVSESLVNLIEVKDETQICPSKLWCLFNNDIIDLSGQVHPGGQYIWEQIRGREVSRFILGAYGLESTSVQAHKHSEYAIAMIKRHKVGSLKPIPFYKDVRSSTQSLIEIDQLDGQFQLSTVYPLSDQVSQFGFQKQGISFRLTLHGIESFGRYFIIRSISNSKISSRNYTMVLCQAAPNVTFRKELLKFADSLLNKETMPVIPTFTDTYHELPLIIKRYESQTGFSQYIHNDNRRELYSIQGPFGTSFGLPEAGHAVIICGGTGLLPFLDLLDYHLKYTIYSAIKEQISEDLATATNPQQLNFRKLKITMFLAVNSIDDLIAKDIYINILRLQKYLKESNFKLIVKGKFELAGAPVTQRRFDRELFEQHMQIQNVSRFLICGPPPMNKDVPLTLQSMGAQESQIHIV